MLTRFRTAATLLPMLAFAAPVAAADVLPLRHGTYVERGTSCGDPPFAALRWYDGLGLAGAHSRACRARIVSRHGHRYTLANRCTDAGSGPAPRSTERLSVTVEGPAAFAIGGARFRLCSPASLPPGLRHRVAP